MTDFLLIRYLSIDEYGAEKSTNLFAKLNEARYLTEASKKINIKLFQVKSNVVPELMTLDKIVKLLNLKKDYSQRVQYEIVKEIISNPIQPTEIPDKVNKIIQSVQKNYNKSGKKVTKQNNVRLLASKLILLKDFKTKDAKNIWKHINDCDLIPSKFTKDLIEAMQIINNKSDYNSDSVLQMFRLYPCFQNVLVIYDQYYW